METGYASYRNRYTVPVAAKKAPKKAATAKKSPAAKPKKQPRLTCRFYKTEMGNEPVREWHKDLSVDVRKEIGSDIQVVQWRWPLGKPLVDGFGDGLFEVRIELDGNIYRVLPRRVHDGPAPRVHEEEPEDPQVGRRAGPQTPA